MSAISLAAKRAFTPRLTLHARHASAGPQDFLHTKSIHTHTTRRMAVDESTQTNGVAAPSAGQLDAREVEQSSTWTVQSGMS